MICYKTNIQKALYFRIGWLRYQSWRDIVYFTYLYPMLYPFIYNCLYIFAADNLLMLDETLNILLKTLASGAIIASIFAALLNLYLCK